MTLKHKTPAYLPELLCERVSFSVAEPENLSLRTDPGATAELAAVPLELSGGHLAAAPRPGPSCPAAPGWPSVPRLARQMAA